jgi:hypothetical protein
MKHANKNEDEERGVLIGAMAAGTVRTQETPGGPEGTKGGSKIEAGRRDPDPAINYNIQCSARTALHG